ncbi:MAG: hypothetical protein HY558_02965 [Euryarchaeota archaeon]|nr:hypothetical protein [Euryarchaeota archaeon]
MRRHRLTSALTALLILTGLYATCVALAYLPSTQPDAKQITVTVTRLEPETAQLGRYRVTPAIPLGVPPALYIDSPLIETPRLWGAPTGYMSLQPGQSYTLTITNRSLRTEPRNWVEPWDLKPAREPLTQRQSRALQAPRNTPALILGAAEPGGWTYPIALAGILLPAWRRKLPKTTIAWLILAWALLGSGVHAGGYLAGPGGLVVPPWPAN